MAYREPTTAGWVQWNSLVKRRWRIWLGLAFLVSLGGTLIVPLSRLVLLGWLRGEATYRCLPSSYWKVAIRDSAWDQTAESARAVLESDDPQQSEC